MGVSLWPWFRFAFGGLGLTCGWHWFVQVMHTMSQTGAPHWGLTKDALEALKQ
jgi:hypothetical protein